MGMHNFLSKKYSISLNEILDIIRYYTLYCKLMKILLVRKKIKKEKKVLTPITSIHN
jgi:RNA processing factor Prp31